MRRLIDPGFKRLLGLLLWLPLMTQAADARAASAAGEIKSTIAEYEAATAKQDYHEALDAAHRLVHLLEAHPDPGATNLAMAVQNLATSQHRAGDVVEARRNYEKSLRIIETSAGAFSPTLLPVLTNLGLMYLDTNRHELAREQFLRAQNVAQRADGVYTLEQLQFIDWLTMIEIDLGDPLAADVQQRFYYRINVQQFGDEPSVLPATHKMANWFRITGRFTDAIRTYNKALFIAARNALGGAQKLPALLGISSTKYIAGRCCADEPLDEVLEIVTNDTSFDQLDKLDALIHVADISMLSKKRRKASNLYEEAWRRTEGSDVLSRELFEEPRLLGISRIDDVRRAYFDTVRTHPGSGLGAHATRVYFVPKQGNSVGFSFSTEETKAQPASPIIGEPLTLCHDRALELAKSRDTSDLAKYFVDIDFTVTGDGGVSNVTLVDSNAPHHLQRYVMNTLRYTRYRPPVREGRLIDREHVRLRQTFADPDEPATAAPRFNRTWADSRIAAALGCQALAML